MASVNNISAILGCVSTAIALLALAKATLSSKAKNYVDKHSGRKEREKIDEEHTNRLDSLEKKIDSLTTVMTDHILTQNMTSKKLLANIIESTYYNNRAAHALDINEVRRITEVYEIYHSEPINGNSYIKSMYEEMMTWDRV